MNLRLATVFVCFLVGGLFALFVPLERIFDVFQMAVSALAIMAAAILVRLNRTMPSLDWKVIEAKSSEDLTSAVVQLAK